ncbi:MAG: hypothetical protein QXT68_07340 [Halobacteria archaeon]
MSVLRCEGCGALVDSTDYPDFVLTTHAEPVPGGCGSALVPALSGPVGE